ncbi:MAG TPA: TCR/Tet family MFS transporter [Gammaproteobacteria bacterium]|jgi:DHA1 family tetracycline resistance protein-like MFS transporter|nr:TCR/Tet family MFS transporter [Gammaproteobacteria bacterium]
MPINNRKAALAFILVTVVIDMLAFGMIIPVLPLLVQDFMKGDAVRTAEVYGLFGTSWALMQFLFSPLQGALSDRFGRRTVILISCTGLGLDFLLMAMAPSLGWLLLGRVISGICAASISTAGAYIADVTPAEKRAAAFGLIGASFGVGFVLGPFLGGVLGHFGARLPFWVAAGMALINVSYGYFVLPESLPPEKRSAFSWKRANPVGALVLLRSHPILAGLATSQFLMNLSHAVLPSTAVLYMAYRYHWGPLYVGYMLMGVGLCAVIVQGGLVKPAVRILGERRALSLGLLFGAAGFAIYGLAPDGAWFLVGVPVMALWGIANPSAQGIMTRLVLPTEQGQLQGALSSIMGIASCFGPGLFTQTFADAIGRHAEWGIPGAPFLLASCLLIGASFIAWRTTRPAHLAAAVDAVASDPA